MTQAILEVRNLTMAFGGVRALDDVSMSIDAGTTTAIVGPNGAGKTTLLNCLCGLYRPRGEIWFNGARVDGRRPHSMVQLGIARTFQGVEQFKVMTPAELVLLGRHHLYRTGLFYQMFRLRRHRREEDTNLSVAYQQLNSLGIEERDSRLETLSYAQRKLADLARALVAQPKLLLLDEPSSGMGPHDKERLHEVLADLRNRSATMVIIDHDLEFVRDLCDYAVVLDFGRKIADGPIETVLEEPAVLQAYIGVAGNAT